MFEKNIFSLIKNFLRVFNEKFELKTQIFETIILYYVNIISDIIVINVY